MKTTIAHEEIEGTYCDGCGRRAGPLGCCTTISQLRGLVAMYEYTLKEISKTKTMTIKGTCCDNGTCLPAEGSQCGFRAGANRAFQLHARAAESVLTPDAQFT